MDTMNIAQSVAIILLGIAILLHVRKESKDAHGAKRN